MSEAIGMIETKGFTGSVEATDAMALTKWLKEHDYVSGPELQTWLQSYIDNAPKIAKADGKKPWFISVEIEPDRITIADHAAGISSDDLQRAFTPAAPPTDPSGLSEFGLGMKAAACLPK